MPHTAQTLPTAPVVLKGLRNSLILAAVTTACADWLLYGHIVGISLALLLCIAGVCIAVAHPKDLTTRNRLMAAGLLVASVLPLVEAVNHLSIFIALAGLCLYTLMISGGLSADILQMLKRVTGLLIAGPFWFIVDLTRSRAFLKRRDRPLLGTANAAAWIIPIALGAVFVLLFRVANPVIEQWMSSIDVGATVQSIDGVRMLFWVLGMGLAWPFMRVRLRPRSSRSKWSSEAATELVGSSSGDVFSHGFDVNEVLWSLVVFNGLFAVQTVLDMVYLWGGAELPKGLTFSEYAHRGTYALMATVLIAASFVLLVLKPGGTLERSPWIRRLAYLWLGQNVLLVTASMLRLNLYVEAYSLTYWRVAALIWMLLILAGLILIAGRIALQRSNGWLVGANAAALAATLYICAFVNFPSVIAGYNIAHSNYGAHGGGALDKSYLCRLGVHAVPEIMKALSMEGDVAALTPRRFNRCVAGSIERHRRKTENWRAWTFRGWRLTRFLDKSVVD